MTGLLKHGKPSPCSAGGERCMLCRLEPTHIPLAPRSWPKPPTLLTPPTPLTPPQPKHKFHTSPVPTGLVESKPNSFIPTSPTPPEPNTYTFHTLDIHLSPHAPYSYLVRRLHSMRHLNLVYHILIHHTHSNHASTGPHTSISVTIAPSHSLSMLTSQGPHQGTHQGHHRCTHTKQ